MDDGGQRKLDGAAPDGPYQERFGFGDAIEQQGAPEHVMRRRHPKREPADPVDPSPLEQELGLTPQEAGDARRDLQDLLIYHSDGVKGFGSTGKRLTKDALRVQLRNQLTGLDYTYDDTSLGWVIDKLFGASGIFTAAALHQYTRAVRNTAAAMQNAAIPFSIRSYVQRMVGTLDPVELLYYCTGLVKVCSQQVADRTYWEPEKPMEPYPNESKYSRRFRETALQFRKWTSDQIRDHLIATGRAHAQENWRVFGRSPHMAPPERFPERRRRLLEQEEKTDERTSSLDDSPSDMYDAPEPF